MKANQKKLIEQKEQERLKCCRQALRQLMIPLAITIVAVLLLYYDASLTGLKINNKKSDLKTCLHEDQCQIITNHQDSLRKVHSEITSEIQHTKSIGDDKK